jgi:hypothetical protein
LIVSLAAAATAHLGLIEDPFTHETRTRLDMARHNIDLLGIIKSKTAGNLESGEERLLEEILAELRLKFVSISERGESPLNGEGSGGG